MTEREFIDELRKLRRERMVDMAEDWHNLTGGAYRSNTRSSGYCDCPSCRQARGCSSPSFDGDALYQLARLHAEGVGHLMRLGASALRHLPGLGCANPWAAHSASHVRNACWPPTGGPPRGDQWPGECEGYQRRPPPREAHHGPLHADFYWSGPRDQKPVFKFVVQNQDARDRHHLDVALGPATTTSGYRPNVTGSVKAESSNLDPWQQATVEVTFEVQHCVPGSVCLPVYVHLDGKLQATHWVKLLIKD